MSPACRANSDRLACGPRQGGGGGAAGGVGQGQFVQAVVSLVIQSFILRTSANS